MPLHTEIPAQRAPRGMSTIRPAAAHWMGALDAMRREGPRTQSDSGPDPPALDAHARGCGIFTHRSNSDIDPNPHLCPGWTQIRIWVRSRGHFSAAEVHPNR